ncbi:MAG: hypothetical protein JO329_23805 [Planctomycetaceae bacterium]|nr:hypothetical protein [Planctomycetaceae bacterium]MBV8381804.1 hypothetical protein [Planctomycetaceae bacterium]MBV8558595.1 hypothetical protein [Planctomycetaceae bacterium]MBV8610572.1 hypothetical protein [Singulisphaera sp.]
MLNFQKIRTRPRVLQQLTGLTVAAFEILVERPGIWLFRKRKTVQLN